MKRVSSSKQVESSEGAASQGHKSQPEEEVCHKDGRCMRRSIFARDALTRYGVNSAFLRVLFDKKRQHCALVGFKVLSKTQWTITKHPC